MPVDVKVVVADADKLGALEIIGWYRAHTDVMEGRIRKICLTNAHQRKPQKRCERLFLRPHLLRIQTAYGQSDLVPWQCRGFIDHDPRRLSQSIFRRRFDAQSYHRCVVQRTGEWQYRDRMQVEQVALNNQYGTRFAGFGGPAA